MVNEHIEWLKMKLPDLCTVGDLIEYGIFSSDQVAYNARIAGDGPPYYRMRRRIFYPKIEVIKYMQRNFHES